MAFKIEKIVPEKHKKTFDMQMLLSKEIHLFGSAFGTKKKEAFYTELHLLLSAGVPLKEVLVLISKESGKPAEQKLFQEIISEILKGKTFSAAMKTQKSFSNYEYYSIKIGEETGTLKKVCKALGNYYHGKNEQRKTIINALSYPIVVMCTAFLAVLFMLQFVVPMFASIFEQNKVPLPVLTKAVIFFSEGFQDNILVLFLAGVAFSVALKLLSKTERFQIYFTGMLLKLPYIGELLRKMYMAQFTQATALLVGSNVPMLQSVQLTKEMIAFYPMRQALQSVEQDLLSGNLLSASLSKLALFDRKMVSLIKVAEETNQNSFIFERLASQYNREVAQNSKVLSTVLEPLIIVFLGIVVALVLIAMYMPMFQLSSVMG